MSNSEKTESKSSEQNDQKHLDRKLLDEKNCQQCQVPSAEPSAQLPGNNGSIASQDFITPQVGLAVISAAIKRYRDSKPM